MTYTDSLGDYNSTMNFVVGSFADIDLNDNEYIRIRDYSVDNNYTFIHNSSYQMY